VGGVVLGIDRFLGEGIYRRFAGLRMAMLTNQSAVTSSYSYSVTELVGRGLNVAYVLAPEHGFWTEYHAGEEVGSYYDSTLGLYVQSIYGRGRGEGYRVLDEVDAVVVDIQDVGVRFYTYVTALLETMDYAARYGVSTVVVLDRPNPLGCHTTEGPLLEVEYRSYVGYHPIPLRYGLTLGELSLLYNSARGLGLDVVVVPMVGYSRSMDVVDAGTPWVPPSPAITDRETVFTYPAVALLEGTNVSEGRGTYTPFKVFGAPFVDPARLAARLNSARLAGVVFRPTYFRPRFSKYSNQRCGGVYVHVVDRRAVEVVSLGLHILRAIYELYPEHLEFTKVNGRFYVDLLLGTPRGREAVVSGDIEGFLEYASRGAEDFVELARNYTLYTS
jgi:uncharacterized protein YbbC (DUF1343 family)